MEASYGVEPLETYQRTKMATSNDLRPRSSYLSSSPPADHITMIPEEESTGLDSEGESLPLLSRRIEEKKKGIKVLN